jgi:hypothetical protein
MSAPAEMTACGRFPDHRALREHSRRSRFARPSLGLPCRLDADTDTMLLACPEPPRRADDDTSQLPPDDEV